MFKLRESCCALAMTAGAAFAGADALSDAQASYAAQGLGMFLHFNMSTYTDQEWADPNQKNPDIFNPFLLNTDQWAWAAKAAGMKYAVLTVKHHDGFSLWDNPNSTYGATHTAWAGTQPPGQADILQRLIDSFHKVGLSVGIYYSMWDRSHGVYKLPSQGPGTPHTADENAAYDSGEINQLLTHYGPIEGVFADAFGVAVNTENYDQVNNAIKSVAPTTLLQINGNVSQGIPSDIAEYEGGQIPAGNTVPSEFLDTLRTDGNWFYHPGGSALQSVQSILDTTQAANQSHAAHLLDVTPDRSGLIPADQVARLIQLGQARGVTGVGPAPWIPQKPTGAGMLANSSFETSSPKAGNPSGGVDGSWTSSGRVTVTSDSGATDGHNFVIFSPAGADSSGHLWQTFTTVPGETYSVWFRLGAETSGRDNAGLRIDASGNQSADYWIQSPVATVAGNPYWEALDQVYSFTATSSATTLDFMDLTDYSGATTHALLDNVVVGQTPEPMVLAFLAVTPLLSRYRRKTARRHV